MTALTNLTSSLIRNAEIVETSVATRIVVPCYNEEKRLDGAAFLAFLKNHADIGFLFVDDGSRDGTFAKLLELKIANPRQVDVLQMPVNGGKAEAVRAGLMKASAGNAQHVGYWDADLATPLHAIEDMLRVAQRHDDIEVLFGSRKQMLGHRINRKLSRLVISRICATLARVAIRLPVADTQCGAKILRNTCSLRLALKAPFAAGWLFDVELFTRLASSMDEPQKAFYEFPLDQWEEVAGSKVSTKAVIRAGWAMMGLILRSRLTTIAAMQHANTPVHATTTVANLHTEPANHQTFDDLKVAA